MYKHVYMYIYIHIYVCVHICISSTPISSLTCLRVDKGGYRGEEEEGVCRCVCVHTHTHVEYMSTCERDTAREGKCTHKRYGHHV